MLSEEKDFTKISMSFFRSYLLVETLRHPCVSGPCPPLAARNAHRQVFEANAARSNAKTLYEIASRNDKCPFQETIHLQNVIIPNSRCFVINPCEPCPTPT
ncbi:hypothetical protein V2G26_007746 [Clonostachys chloroleuca]